MDRRVRGDDSRLSYFSDIRLHGRQIRRISELRGPNEDGPHAPHLCAARSMTSAQKSSRSPETFSTSKRMRARADLRRPDVAAGLRRRSRSPEPRRSVRLDGGRIDRRIGADLAQPARARGNHRRAAGVSLQARASGRLAPLRRHERDRRGLAQRLDLGERADDEEFGPIRQQGEHRPQRVGIDEVALRL